MRHNFGVGFRGKNVPFGGQLVAQFTEIFNDAIVDNSHFGCCVRVGIVFCGLAVGGPTGVTNAAKPVQRFQLEAGVKIFQLALGTAARDDAMFERGNTGRIISAIFQALESLDDLTRNRLTPENTNNAAHIEPLVEPRGKRTARF